MYQKEKNPINYAYNVLKNNALRRKKPFELTLAEFKDFCQETGYMDKKGRTASSASIDRKDPSEGYTRDNIQLLSVSENSIKGNEERAPF